MIWLSTRRCGALRQTEQQRGRLNLVVVLLLLGVLFDLIGFMALSSIDDKDFVVFLSGLMGGRVLLANLEAIVQFHRQ